MTDAMGLTWRAFSTPKAGNTQAEYEDALAGDPEKGRFAIADGASESAFADVWARLVVEALVESSGPWSARIPAAQKEWLGQVQDRDLPWYAEAKFQEGAYAAVLSLVFKGHRWLATAIGDCCLFQIRDNRLLRAFPIEQSGEFGNRPSLLGSRNRPTENFRSHRVHHRSEFRAGDVFCLMTDALAEWSLKQIEQEQQPWEVLQAVADNEQFEDLIKKLREAKELRNDDVTLVLIEAQNS